jgi:hypothetical protein
MSVIPALGRLRQKDHELEASVGALEVPEKPYQITNDLQGCVPF